MALDMNDLMAIRGVDREGDRNWGYGYGGYGNYGHGSMTPYEQVKTSQMLSKRPSGVAVAGLTVGAVAVAAGIGAWIFGGMQASAKAKEAAQIGIAAKEQAAVQFQASTKLLDTVRDDTQRTIDRILRNVDNERRERIQGDYSITQTVNDTQTGSQQGSLSALQQAELAASQATQQVMQQTFADAVTGRSSLNPTPVNIYSAPQPCGCPGCGCNG